MSRIGGSVVFLKSFYSAFFFNLVILTSDVFNYTVVLLSVVSLSSNLTCLLQQEDICEFPSKEFYGGKLKTETQPKPSLFNTTSKQTCIVFGHVEGKEKSLVVSTERGNESSKANVEEAEEVVS